jgi:hypothetical protein
MAKRLPFVNDANIYVFSSTISTLIKPKGIFRHLGFFEFLIAINNFAAHVVIWSSMEWSTYEEIMDYLFLRCYDHLIFLARTTIGRLKPFWVTTS